MPRVRAGALSRAARRRREEEAALRDPLVDEVLDLQRDAGNRAVSGLLQREPAAGAPTFSPFGPAKPIDPYGGGGPIYDAEHTAATAEVDRCADEILRQSDGRTPPFQSVAEIVALARGRVWRTADGRTGTVAQKISAPNVEQMVRDRARTKGVPLLEHRKMDDKAGVENETKAMLANMGVDGKASFGGSSGKLEIDLAGELSGEAQLGRVKVEGSLSKTKAKAELSAGTLFKVSGEITVDEERKVAGWSAKLTFGTTQDIVTPAEVAELMKETKETFEKGAVALHAGGGQALLDTHAGAMKKAVTEILETGRKKKEQRGGVTFGAGVERKESGETIGTVTMTWSF